MAIALGALALSAYNVARAASNLSQRGILKFAGNSSVTAVVIGTAEATESSRMGASKKEAIGGKLQAEPTEQIESDETGDDNSQMDDDSQGEDSEDSFSITGLHHSGQGGSDEGGSGSGGSSENGGGSDEDGGGD